MNGIFGVDVDDVVGDLVTPALGKYNHLYGDKVKKEDIISWDIHKYTKKASAGKFYDILLSREIYDNVLPIDGAKAGVDRLREMGFRVIFITSTAPGIEGRKYQWLYENNFLNRKEDYFEATDKSLIACDYLLDDKPENAIKAWGAGLLFRQPWNHHISCNVGNFIPVINGWSEVLDYVMMIEHVLNSNTYGK